MYLCKKYSPIKWLICLLIIQLLQFSESIRKIERSRRSLKDLKALMNKKPLPLPVFGYCDFDKVCDWQWDKSENGTFKVVKAPLANQLAPTADAGGNIDGKFLWVSGTKNKSQLWSPPIPPTETNCYLEFSVHQVNMENGKFELILQNLRDKNLSVAQEHAGSDMATWEKVKMNLGGLNQKYRIILEVDLPYDNSSIAIDNLELVNCFPDQHNMAHGNCTAPKLFQCANGSCLSRNHVCDLVADCADGEDENAECDKVPEFGKCDFENGWCEYKNDESRPMKWEIHQGPPLPTARLGPNTDHTFRNYSGTYIYVDMSGANSKLGDQSTLNSPIFNPTPPYHNNRSSPYFDSCKLRFFCHQSTSQVVLSLYLVQLMSHQNHTERLLWSYKDQSLKNDVWNSLVISIPAVKFRYYLQIEATKSYRSGGKIAIDDISLSPECFGAGVPAEIVGDFNYYNQRIPPDDFMPTRHTDFMNQTTIEITTCGQTGRFGPTPEQCYEFHNNTDVEVLSSSSEDEGDANLRSKGIQRWIAPSGGYYTIIAMGARGGRGALSTGVSLGSMVRGVVELEKGQQLYFMIGQPGTDACPKKLGSNDTCQQVANNTLETFPSVVRQVKNIELKDGGGGGGGATYIFTIKPNGEQQPLLIAAGGGGLGPHRYRNDGVQNGKGKLPHDRNPENGVSYKENAGGGGGWLKGLGNQTSQRASGMALSEGGIGGVGCGPNRVRGHSDGGFGGGGGGCLSGGGGGGYAGGATGHVESGNGEGGFSYVSPDLLHISYIEKANSGPGQAFIIPAKSGCGCYYRCVVVDRHLSDTRCLCPGGWHLGDDSRSCIRSSDSALTWQIVMIGTIVVGVVFVGAVSGLCFSLYQKYQNHKALIRRRQVMFGNGTELTVLRVVSDSMMTEFNPNYEFAGNLYSFKDLPQIPRDNITLVKPLGQGAFGEVYQGIYKYRRNEEHPVAVKTLPSLSTSQTEADFVMEALIMSKFDHPNIVHFIGVSFDIHPRYIIIELLAGGDLKNFLREERPKPDRPTSLTMQSLIMCAFDVAKGCMYMEDKRFIHRDIAARNCLLTCKGPGRVVKIADFGMARDIYRSDYYRKGGKAMLPIKWMPPESFLDGIFTTKTDIWAFGVLLWEIMSFGYMPYTGCANREVMSMVTNGGRLEKPAGCPDPIYGIMTRCWHPNPDERPSFNTIVERIGYCLQDPDVINHPTPNYDLLPICDREITIMRPDPETECINVHSDLDYMQPRSFRPQIYRIGQAPGIVYASLRHSSEDHENSNNICRDSSTDSPPREHFHKHVSTPEEQDLNDVCDNKEHESSQPKVSDEPNANVTSSPTSSVHQSVKSISNINLNESTDNCNATCETTKPPIIPGENGNGESTTTTDTNSDSIFIHSYGTPLDTASSSPNTRTSSPNRISINTGVDNGNENSNNVNGMRKSALKAALSLDPNALCRGAIPYDKISFSPSKPRSSNPGSTELRKDSLTSHELPREEECSC